MMIDIGPKFYTVWSPHSLHDLKVKTTDLNVLCLSFALKFKDYIIPYFFQPFDGFCSYLEWW